MKPRTKQEKEVIALSQTLKPMTDKQHQWAKSALSYKAHSTGKAQWCTACGEVMPHGLTTCPHCGATLEVFVTRRRQDRLNYYATIHTTCRGYQVARYFLVKHEAHKGYAPDREVSEVCQEWLNVATGEPTILAKDVTMNPMYYDIWKTDSAMSVKPYPTNYHTRAWRRYHIYSEVEKWERLQPILKRNGAQRKDMGVQPMELYRHLLTDHIAEELAKTQPSLLAEHIIRGSIEQRIHAVRICNRNGYTITDGAMWLDYIRQLERLGYDTHNAHYVCPQDLVASHNEMTRRIERIEAKQRAKNEQERIKRELDDVRKAESLYKRLHKKYLAIFFGNENIEISVAKSVKDIYEEGKAMHHCVYACGYHKRENSLILFARDKATGGRIETIEVDLSNFKVAQSRGVCNQLTPQHDEILALCQANMHLIRAAA